MLDLLVDFIISLSIQDKFRYKFINRTKISAQGSKLKAYDNNFLTDRKWFSCGCIQ